MTEPKEDIKKTPIHKKPMAKDAETDSNARAMKEDSIEIPVSKILIWIGILLVAALAIWGLTSGADWIKGISQGDTAAYVNGQAITCAEIDKSYETVPDTMRAYITKEVLLNQTINEMVIKQEVARRDIQIEDTHITAMINNIKAQFPDEKSFNDTLAQQGIAYEEIVEQLTLSLKLNKMLQQDMPELRVTDSEIEAFFEENKESLSVPEQVRASHILVNSSELADQIVEMLEDGADFAELAKNYSIDTSSAVYGGELGYFSRGRMIAEFEESAFSLSVGEVSEPVKTIYGYHIIKLTDRKEAEVAVLDDETKSLIELNIFNNKWDENKETVNIYIADLRSRSEIKLVKAC